MFSHIFKYRIKSLLRTKEMIFWTLAFPILLGLLFSLAFSNLSNSEKFEKVNIAVVDNTYYKKDTSFKSALAGVSNVDDKEGENDLFKVTLTTKEECENLLLNNKIDGYILYEGEIKLIVNKSGFNQTIIKGFLDDYNQTSSAISAIIRFNPMILQDTSQLIDDLANRQEYVVEETSATNKTSPDNTLIYYYALLATSCFYGGFMGMYEVIVIQANLSATAARVSVAPTNKMKLFISSMSAATAIQLAVIFIIIAFLKFVLGVDFGSKIGYILLTCVVGCFTGVSFGAMISAIVKKGEGIKTAILIGTTMSLSFLAGLMQAQIKYLVTNAVPIMAYLNPLNLITDSFYILYYYDTYTKYFINIACLAGFTIIFSLVTFLIIRRQKYASI